MMHNFIAKPGTKKFLINVFVPEVVLAADTESAAGILTGQGAMGVAYGDITYTSYIREGDAADTAIVEVDGTLGTWVSGGWKEIDATNMPGWYQFSVPDAVLRSQGAVKFADIGIEIPDTKGASVQVHIDLIRSLAF